MHQFKAAGVFAKQVFFNTDYRFVQRLFPVLSILGIIAWLVVPTVDQKFGYYSPRLLSFPTAIFAFFLWFFPRKGPVSFYHKLHWELMLIYSFPVFCTLSSLAQIEKTALVVTNMIQGAMVHGFLAKPWVFMWAFPTVTILSFVIHIMVTGADYITLWPLFFYPLYGALITGLVSSVIRAFIEYYYNRTLDTELKLVQMRATEQINELKYSALTSKCDPHFLFNTLNTLLQLGKENSGKVEPAIASLCSIFRYILSASDRKTVALSEELSVVQSYLELEKLRFGSCLRYHIVCYGDIDQVQLPALTIQVLVENAIKHGFSPRGGEGLVTINAKVSAETAEITVCDDGVGFNDCGTVFGYGLSIVEGRLRHIWGKHALMNIKSIYEKGTTVSINIPINRVISDAIENRAG